MMMEALSMINTSLTGDDRYDAWQRRTIGVEHDERELGGDDRGDTERIVDNEREVDEQRIITGSTRMVILVTHKMHLIRLNKAY